MPEVNVLIVDDEQEYVEVLTERLALRKLGVRGVTSGEAALRALAEQPADVVILDVSMPGLSGIDTLKEIKKRDPSVEVILLSGHAEIDTSIQGVDLGAFDYLLKPVGIDELVYRIEDAFRQKSLGG